MDLKKFNLVELNTQEMTEITGGSWIGRVINSIGNAISDAYYWTVDMIEAIGEISSIKVEGQGGFTN
ncbi:TPA: hypothetical protein ACG0AB_003629 [Elizabethkingia anophelis]|uniref:hypothetical protein n=1 Tax=Elizabethkingia anophelis TaxID=1117645 RepID=UPI000669A8B1|nr:hypothetical protein [Elizabethkingia anophelis]AQW90779.1 hypothetical protein BBD28_08935 [Elizabethkingia anophelis]KUY16855.1 hypothetical protein ATB94_05450 [Elizabethkingia anophelis]MCT3675363.1 hypothetical protein [Elizabethkingia anophelis]MCT3682801.1 hypothetical protein [Elizabethkingia anophelis]MCT3701566.1 hypothetical protein [Elizabethkingia anophelis]